MTASKEMGASVLQPQGTNSANNLHEQAKGFPLELPEGNAALPPPWFWPGEMISDFQPAVLYVA